VPAGARKPLLHFDGDVTSLILDVTDAAEIQGAVENVESIDILISNAATDLHDDLSDGGGSIGAWPSSSLVRSVGRTSKQGPIRFIERELFILCLALAGWPHHLSEDRLPQSLPAGCCPGQQPLPGLQRRRMAPVA
jgi:NAD(P)-dependent dehydrogenase (short-subunit alcohol dehydrogenase family)